MGKIFLRLNDAQPYKTAFNLSNYVWEIVIKWDCFAKDTVGKQFVKAVDSISVFQRILPKALADILKKIK